MPSGPPSSPFGKKKAVRPEHLLPTSNGSFGTDTSETKPEVATSSVARGTSKPELRIDPAPLRDNNDEDSREGRGIARAGRAGAAPLESQGSVDSSSFDSPDVPRNAFATKLAMGQGSPQLPRLARRKEKDDELPPQAPQVDPPSPVQHRVAELRGWAIPEVQHPVGSDGGTTHQQQHQHRKAPRHSVQFADQAPLLSARSESNTNSSSSKHRPVTFSQPQSHTNLDDALEGSGESEGERRSVSPVTPQDPHRLHIPGAMYDVSRGEDSMSRSANADLDLGSPLPGGQQDARRQRFPNSPSSHISDAGGTKAGVLLAAVASGTRLKSNSSYRRQLDVSGLRFHGEHDRDDDRDNTVALATLGSSQPSPSKHAAAAADDDVTSLASTALTDNLGRRHRKKTIFDILPMWIQVCALMMIPVIFVVVYLSITLHAGVRDLAFIRNTEALVRDMKECENALAIERGRSSGYLAATDNETMAPIWDTVVAARRVTDAECDQLFDDAQGSRYDVISVEYTNVLRESMSTIELVRFATQSRTIAPLQVRNRLRAVISDVTNGITLLSKNSAQARKFLTLRELRASANRMGLCRAIGFDILLQGAVNSPEQLIDIRRRCYGAFTRHLRDFRDIADGVAMEQYEVWHASPQARGTMQTVEFLSSAPIGQPIDMDPEEYWASATAVVELLESMSEVVLEDIVAAEDEYQIVVEESIKLSVTLFVSIVGVMFVSRAQRLATTRVELALQRTVKTAFAVQAFIPRSFLKLMAVDSILNIERGDQTLVAVTMLFCDIRNFTGISEHMSNEQLFEWLQAHLTRMTRMTEKHHGFVDKFIGDAVSSIFVTPSHAVKCAVSMQAATDALCYELIAHNEDHMVRIGVGVHQAIVGVGILGNDKHHSCAIVSAEVNIANQLEALTKQYGARIIVTSKVFDQLRSSSFDHRILGCARLSLSGGDEYTLYDIYQADSLASKKYKRATCDLWKQMLVAREKGDATTTEKLLVELSRVAAEFKIKDAAIDVKRRNQHTRHDQFDM